MDAHLLRPSKPVLTSIPLVVSAGDFACTSSGEAASPAPRTESLRGRTTDDGDLLELEQARKKLGLTCPSFTEKKKKKGLLGWLRRKSTTPQ
ncbi:hypothetical protein C2E20_4040 [Micractinium conductrix]|uniref:Uncharacterized protein n=1 Tax=Micractinium conductrix TaxID=554055 RepID=A0A2P6VFK2_9CHLO|nr:hypothetical protein C2E20_4040 [Micractinium conductrix]|eukprot:PSC72857.1 hypothetical protein C2E20_4040 [Micractinium conductrix]